MAKINIMEVNNHVTLIGNLGKEFEVKQFENGRTIAKASFATNNSFKNKEGNTVQETQWHNLAVFGKRAELIAKYTSKGSHLAVSGKLAYNKYTDSEGVKRSSTQIIVNDFKFLDRKDQQIA